MGVFYRFCASGRFYSMLFGTMNDLPVRHKTVTKRTQAASAAGTRRKGRTTVVETPEEIERRKLFGNTIREHRQSRGWTLTALQERSGINNGNLSKIENGLQSLSNKTMESL